ncbi:MAG TPA: DUF2530 domain-containing protein [Micromonosporaceae bacterium]|jgi:hypothetical protein|nr:DUF2530 domain-containing protein [Micromonosporaceae bacterium]
MVPFAVVGIGIWAVAGLALWVAGRTDWAGICLAGFLWGFVGLAVMLRHDANRKRRRMSGHGVTDSTSLSS